MSRAFGNARLKQFITAQPEVWSSPLENVRGVVLATDGLTHSVPNQNIVSTLVGLVPRPAEVLARLAVSKSVADNVCALSVRIARVRNPKP